MSRSEERRAAEEYVALVFDDWDAEEQAAMVSLMCDDEPDESEPESDVPSTPRVPRPPGVLSKEIARQISDEMTAVLARVRAAAEADQ